jgi:hypothetical protein
LPLAVRARNYPFCMPEAALAVISQPLIFTDIQSGRKVRKTYAEFYLSMKSPNSKYIICESTLRHLQWFSAADRVVIQISFEAP